MDSRAVRDDAGSALGVDNLGAGCPATGSPMVAPCYWAILLGIITFGVLIRLFHFRLSMGCDDQVYLILSQHLGDAPRPDVPAACYTRMLWRCVLAVWGSLVGFSLERSAVLMFLLSCITTVTVAEFTRRAFGAGAGLWAAAVYATHPLCVIFDTLTLPDNLGVSMLAAALLLFLVYLRQTRLSLLAASGVVLGLLFSVKAYFILPALPFGVTILWQRLSWRVRLRDAAVFSASVLIGAGLDSLLQYWFIGDPLAHLSSAVGYADRPSELLHERSTTGLRLLHSLFWERCQYFKWLLDDWGGIVNGFVVLLAALFLASKSRGRLDCRLLLMTGALFCVFLLAMPAKLSPLVLVEMQERYLIVLLPVAAIGGGAALWATLTSLGSRSLRWLMSATLAAGLCYNVVVANGMIDHHRAQEFAGIRQVLQEAQKRGVTELVLPRKYDLFLPDSYYSYGVEFSFGDVEDPRWTRNLPSHLGARPGRTLFIPERPFPRTGAYSKLRDALESQGFDVEEVRVPRTSYRAWLRWLDLIDAHDQLVGRLARSSSHQASSEASQEGEPSTLRSQ